MFSPSKKQTIEYLKELRHEVNDFHPILNVLFKRLPSIERVHYTQGPDELGADFILFRRDETLLRTTHIGVVVKIDSIKQNTTEVERQIKECFIPRKTADGVQVQIREVWVVTAHDITRNAKEVLSKQYVDRKIEFISGQDLAQMIDQHAPDAFAAFSPALMEFAEGLISSLDLEDQRALVVPGLESFYVEPRIILQSFSGYGSPRKTARGARTLDELLRSALEQELIVVEAPAGGGKSKLARELVKRILSSPEFADGKILPSLAHARDFVQNANDEIKRIRAKVRDAAGTEGSLVAFIDGFDEVDLSESERPGFVESLIAAANANEVSIVLLSRPFDEASVLGARVHSLPIYKIEQLKGPRAISFLSKIAGQLDVRSRLVSDLGRSDLLRALDGAPIAYILLGRLIAENQQDLPSNLTELFHKYVELVLGRWEMSKGLRSQQEYEVLVETLSWLASFMLDHDLPEVGRSEVEKWAVQYCAQRGLGIDAKALVDRVCRRDSILYLRTETGSVGFRHRAFAEFFYARVLSRKSQVELSEKVFSPYWLNSYFFLAGLKRDCPDLVEALTAIHLVDEGSRIVRVLNFGNLLLAAYLTPTETCKTALISIASEIAELYDLARDPQSNSLLSNLPTLQMLGVLALSFSGQYGYKRFRAALEEAIYDLEVREPSEKLAIMLFLLDTAYKEAGGDLRFDELIEKFGDSLPVVVKLAIKHESHRMKAVSEKISKLERNLRRAFRASKGAGEYLDKLYNTPVKKLAERL